MPKLHDPVARGTRFGVEDLPRDQWICRRCGIKFNSLRETQERRPPKWKYWCKDCVSVALHMESEERKASVRKRPRKDDLGVV